MTSLCIFIGGFVLGWVLRTFDSYFFDPRIRRLKATDQFPSRGSKRYLEMKKV
jgi:hypothetical protein